MNDCVYSVLSCVDSGLAAGWSPVQGILPTVYMIKKLQNRRQGSSWTVAPTDYYYYYYYYYYYCTALAVLVGLQTTPLNLSHSLFPTSPSVLQSLCYERFPPPLGCRSSIQLLTAVFAGWLTDSPAKLQTEELTNSRTDSVGVGVQPKIVCGEPSRSHQSQPFRNALL
jgi:hypothetical protein